MLKANGGAAALLARRVAIALTISWVAGDPAADRVLAAQETTPPVEPAPPAASPTKETLLPSLDFYFPEGELDFRLNKLLKGSFYEGQLRYDFVKGDIEAFLRYRYYGYQSVYQLGLFDAVEFDPIEEGTNDFERTRGWLLLIERPFSYHSRAFFLAEFDRITSSKEEFRLTTNKTDSFVRVGYQLGTSTDVGLNSIVGETRAERRPLLTAHREIAPFGAGFSSALSYGFDLLGDFDYVKLEFAGLKRFNLGRRSFLISRLHGGSFLHKGDLDVEAPVDSTDRYAIPRGVFLRLDGRDNLKGLDERLRGTEELHATLELFVPWFIDDRRPAMRADWNSWYWIVYAGYGAIGFDRDVLSDSSSYITDVGFGFETSFQLKDYTVFLGGVLAEALETDGDIKARFSLKARH